MQRTMALLMASFVYAGAAQAQSFNNQCVVALHKAGLGESAIVAKVRSLPCGYDVSVDALIALKNAGVSDSIIAAMVDRCGSSVRAQGTDAIPADPGAAHAPGLYLARGSGAAAQMTLIRPAKAGGLRVTGNGSIMFPYMGHLTVPDAKSRIRTGDRRPTFYFYFPQTDKRVSDFGTPNSIAAQSPSEFTLVQFRLKGDEREVLTGKLAAFNARVGISPKEAIRFSVSEIGDAAYKVVPDVDLTPGEYAFVLTGANSTARIYDFSID